MLVQKIVLITVGVIALLALLGFLARKLGRQTSLNENDVLDAARALLKAQAEAIRWTTSAPSPRPSSRPFGVRDRIKGSYSIKPDKDELLHQLSVSLPGKLNELATYELMHLLLYLAEVARIEIDNLSLKIDKEFLTLKCDARYSTGSSVQMARGPDAIPSVEIATSIYEGKRNEVVDAVRALSSALQPTSAKSG